MRVFIGPSIAYAWKDNIFFMMSGDCCCRLLETALFLLPSSAVAKGWQGERKAMQAVSNQLTGLAIALQHHSRQLHILTWGSPKVSPLTEQLAYCRQQQQFKYHILLIELHYLDAEISLPCQSIHLTSSYAGTRLQDAPHACRDGRGCCTHSNSSRSPLRRCCRGSAG